MECRPEDLLFVDDKERNVAAARALGWQGLVFNAAEAPADGFAATLANSFGLLGAMPRADGPRS